MRRGGNIHVQKYGGNVQGDSITYTEITIIKAGNSCTQIDEQRYNSVGKSNQLGFGGAGENVQRKWHFGRTLQER